MARAALSDAEADAKNAERMLVDLETAIPKVRACVGRAEDARCGWGSRLSVEIASVHEPACLLLPCSLVLSPLPRALTGSHGGGGSAGHRRRPAGKLGVGMCWPWASRSHLCNACCSVSASQLMHTCVHRLVCKFASLLVAECPRFHL